MRWKIPRHLTAKRFEVRCIRDGKDFGPYPAAQTYTLRGARSLAADLASTARWMGMYQEPTVFDRRTGKAV